MTTNNQTRQAIQKLVVKYKDDSLANTYGKINSCSLCTLFNGGYSTYDCINCPNIAFKGVGYSFEFPCVQRNYKFLTLDWDLKNHRLVEFWTAILSIIPADDEKFICDKLVQKEILKIAKKINK